MSKYGYWYMSPDAVSLTEYGWAVIDRERVDISDSPSDKHSIPVSLDAESAICRMYLWQESTKDLKLPVQKSVENNADSIPVQYSPSGGTYDVSSRHSVNLLKGKSEFKNIFADYNEADQGGFI